MEEPDKQVMRLITAGGLWTGKHAQKAEGSEVARCRLCGEETPTMVGAHRHMFWRCCHDEVRAYRQDAWRFDEGFDPERLPDILACYGVAPAMWLDPDKTFWGTPTTAECWRPSWPAAAAADGVVRAYRVEHPDMNARQILEHMKGRTDAIDPTDAPVTWEEAPTDPNAFSDGSAVPPGTAIDTLAGAGIWWPGRTRRSHPPTSMEETYAEVAEEPGGMRLSAAIGGMIQTPMRAELCGAILALAAGRGLHLAVDNSSVVKGIKKALRAKRKARPFHYYRRPNTDLWKVIWDMVKSRPAYTVRVKWTKGHAKEEHIEKGQTTKWEAQQNEKADHAADEGRLQHDANLRALMPYFVATLSEYQDMVAKLRVYMLLTIKKRMDILGEEEAGSLITAVGKKNAVPFRGLPAARQGEHETLARFAVPGAHAFLEASSRTRVAIQDFLRGLSFVRGESQSQQGATWLELGLLFELRTGTAMPRRWPPTITNTERLHGKGASIGQHIAAFKQGIHEVMRMTIHQRDHDNAAQLLQCDVIGDDGLL